MSEIIVKCQNALDIIQNPSLTPQRKVLLAPRALSELTVSNLSSSAEEMVTTHLVASNQIISAYEIKEDADYDKLTDADALHMLSHFEAMARCRIDSETQRVMRELDTADRILPVAAIQEVRQHRDLFVPLLMSALEQAILKIRSGDNQEGQAAFFAVFLLTELEATEAFPLLLEMLRLPGEGPFDLIGGGVHELVAPMLALFSAGNTEVVDKIAGDRSVNLYVRWEAAKTYMFLVRDRVITRQAAIDTLEQHFQDCVASEDYEMLTPLVCELSSLAAETSLEMIRSAFQRHLVDEVMIRLAKVESKIAGGEETVRKSLEWCGSTGLPDTIAELGCWASFRVETPPKSPKPTPPRAPAHRSVPAALSDRGWKKDPLDQGGKKVGRNNPCPCGSGKKFKNCCLRKQA